MRKRSWVWVLALASLAHASIAASPAPDARRATPTPSAASLAQFYPAPLSTSPVGVDEDPDVWLAKVQGLIANAPQWLQQNVLASQNAQEFQANLALLEQMQEGAIKQRAGAIKRLAVRGNAVAKEAAPSDPTPKLGTGGRSDLVFTTLDPCRIMDTRNAAGGSGLTHPVVGNTLYSIPGFVSAGSTWALYGGNSSSDCGLNDLVGANIWAVAIVITVLNPNFDAYLGVYDMADLSAVLSNVALNYTHGQGLSTLFIVTQAVNNTIYFALPAGLSANIIFDVVGYFAISQATALDCTHDIGSNLLSVPPGAWAAANSAGCPAGRTLTGGGCTGPPTLLITLSSFNYFFGFTRWACGAYNSGTGTETADVNQICCRIPGR